MIRGSGILVSKIRPRYLANSRFFHKYLTTYVVYTTSYYSGRVVYITAFAFLPLVFSSGLASIHSITGRSQHT